MEVSTVSARIDTYALSFGSRIGVSGLMLGCVLAIVLGASSMLSSLQRMESDLNRMSGQLDVTNAGLAKLNKIMDSLPPTSSHLKQVVKTVRGTSTKVGESATSVKKLNTDTQSLNTMLAAIAVSTAEMRGSLESVDSKTGKLGSTVEDLNTKIKPLVVTQHGMFTEVQRMQGGIDGMNGSLAYVIRTLNYITRPPTGQGFTVRADLPKEALPPIPGVKVTADPVAVFPRNAWKVYTGP